MKSQSRWIRRGMIGVLLFAMGCSAPGRPAPGASASPRLVVMLVVDQMRSDYITLYGHQWSKGLRRLVDSGASFPLAEYPYAITVTCAGHATISTGQYPSTHGMIGNSWHDRALRKNVACTEDAAAMSVPFGGREGAEHHSLTYLKTNTFSDELRQQSRRTPTVVGISLKARSATTLAGHGSPTTYAVWEEDNGTWATSTAYTEQPAPAIDQWATDNPISAAYGTTWDRLLPDAAYLFADDLPGEPADHTFPHVLTSASGTPDTAFANQWERSPFSDAALGSLGQHLVRELKMGQSPDGPDFLAISFSALDLVGHAFGPRSHEVQDTLARLDVTIGALLDTLDAEVGRDHYVVALSADHGVAPLPEQAALTMRSAGRFRWNESRQAIEAALTPLLGEGPHVTTVSGANVYLTPETRERVMATPRAREAVTRALAGVEGLGRVYWADELSSGAATLDAELTLARRSFVADRSGDLLVMYAPYWIGQATGTTHGSPYGYDRRVPILFAGAGITPGTYWTAASPADIAPTLAQLAGITLAQADGRVLTDAVR